VASEAYCLRSTIPDKKPLRANASTASDSARNPRLASTATRFAFVCASAIASLFANVAAAAPARFTRFSVEHGLSQSNVQAILQDHQGFLWFGTEEGLNRFDGYTFRVFKHDPRDPESLPDDRISALYEDRQRRLWVGVGSGLGLFDRRTETFTQIGAISERVISMAEDPDGTLWVATEGAGLYEREPATGVFRALQHSPEDPDSLCSHDLSALLRDRSGRLWIGTRDAGLERLVRDGAERRFVHFRHDPRDPRSLGYDAVWGLAEDTAGNVWVATYGGGLSVLDPATGSFRQHRHLPADPRSLGTDLVTCVLLDRSGTLWIGTDGAGVQRYDPGSHAFARLAHAPSDPASLSRNVVRALYEDVQGQLWVGTYQGGVNVLKNARRAFGYFTQEEGDPSSLQGASVGAFLEDSQGHVWVGTEAGTLNCYERQTGSFVRHPYPSTRPGGSAILCLHQDRRGRIWVGTYRGGLGRFDPAHGTFAVRPHRRGDPGSVSEEIWAIAEDPDGSLWLGTNTGLERFEPERNVVTSRYQAPTPGGLSHAQVRALLYDAQGTLWVGTLGGLLRRSRDGFVRYHHDAGDPRSLSHDSVACLHEDGRGRLWIGTLGGGLNRFEPASGTFTAYRGFPSNVIYRIEEGHAGELWLGTNNGLVRFDPATERTETFDLTNGLQSLEFHLGASLRTREGRLLFGSVNGFYDFDPTAIEPDTFAPPVALTSLRRFDERVKLPRAAGGFETMTLSPRDKIFSLEFAALDFTFPRRNRYAYLMEGLSEQWVQLGAKREITFTNLDPGTYTFRVKASNSDGVWAAPSTAALRVIVEPPFWRTWWFRGLAIGLFGLALAAAHRLRVQRLTADIAERMRAEAALRQAEERYRSIFENATEGIFQATPGGRFLAVNPALARMLGYASAEQMLSEITDIERQIYVEPGRRYEMLRLADERGIVHGFECAVRCRDGTSIWVSMSTRAVRDGAGNILYYEGISEDISDRRRAQELQDSLRRSETMSAMGSLVAGVAHEVRSPLFGISANLDVLEQKAGANAELGSSVTRMREQVNRLSALMQELLDYGKPAKSAKTPESMAAVVAEAVESCTGLAARGRVEIVNGVDSVLPPVTMDRGRLVQVFQNLLQNAIQHAPRGSAVSLSAWTEATDDGPGVVVTIEDTGPGIPPSDLQRIFEPFVTRRRGGTGLGLAIVQRIVDEHGGTVTAINRPAGGATITVRLPRTPRC
jgi:PAS domain S-box-containing protein